jgi:hypothetical protein
MGRITDFEAGAEIKEGDLVAIGKDGKVYPVPGKTFRDLEKDPEHVEKMNEAIYHPNPLLKPEKP